MLLSLIADVLLFTSGGAEVVLSVGSGKLKVGFSSQTMRSREDFAMRCESE
jgi:hypothetical protein